MPKRGGSSKSSRSSSSTATHVRPKSTSHSSNLPAKTTNNSSHASTTKPTAQQGQNSTTSNQHTQNPVQPMPTSQGSGLMGNIVSSAIGSMIGVTAAETIMGAFKGDKESQEKLGIVDAEKGPCSIQFQSFQKCVENNGNNVSACQWAFDMFNACKNQNGQQPSNEKYY